MFGQRARPRYVVITGHVDHGKSTLIGRLLVDTGSLPKERLAETLRAAQDLASENELAFVTDQLEEERRLNITLDTCQIPFHVGKKLFVIIDAPGHAGLLKNMLTGAGAADSAVLIVSAADGIMEQTRRHAYALGFLGVKTAIVALNKMDLVGYSEETYRRLRDDAAALLAGVGLAMSACVPVSAKSGENVSMRAAQMGWYRGPALIEAMAALPEGHAAQASAHAVMPVQDVYSLDGRPLAVGRVVSGALKRGARVRVFPSNAAARISEIRVFGRSPHKAGRGENVGLFLEDGSAENCASANRGSIVASDPSPLETSQIADGRIFWIGPDTLEAGETVVIKCATQESACTVERVSARMDPGRAGGAGPDDGPVLPNEVAALRIRTQKPLVIDRSGSVKELARFALEKNGLLQGFGYFEKSA